MAYHITFSSPEGLRKVVSKIESNCFQDSTAEDAFRSRKARNGPFVNADQLFFRVRADDSHGSTWGSMVRLPNSGVTVQWSGNSSTKISSCLLGSPCPTNLHTRAGRRFVVTRIHSMEVGGHAGTMGSHVFSLQRWKSHGPGKDRYVWTLLAHSPSTCLEGMTGSLGINQRLLTFNAKTFSLCMSLCLKDDPSSYEPNRPLKVPLGAAGSYKSLTCGRRNENEKI